MRAEKHVTQLQVGAFVIVGLTLLMMIIFMLGSEKRIFDQQYTLVSWFKNISGLRVGASVQLAGIHVGTVNQILFGEGLEQKEVKVLLRISTDYQERIRTDSEASIVTQGLLGDKMVFVSVGSMEFPALKSDDVLLSSSPSGITELLEKGETLMNNATKTVDQVNEILKTVRTGEGVVHGIIYDKDLMADLKGISDEFSQISEKINSGHGTIGAFVNDPSLFQDLKTLLGKANRNKLIRAVVRETLRTKDEKLLTTDGNK